MKIEQRDSFIIYLKCPGCNRLHSRTNNMRIVDIKRRWDELVCQKEMVNAQEYNLCCGVQLEYYIGKKLAREVIYNNGEKK